VIYKSESRALVPIFNERLICSIGRNINKTGCLDPIGVKKALKSLPRFEILTRAMGVKELHILATAATREALDGKKFLEDIKDIFDHSVIQLISGDLGGGSLELANIKGGVYELGQSLPLGHLRLNANLGLKPDQLSNYIDNILSSCSCISRTEGRRFYAFGGAWRAIARLHMFQIGYPLRVVHNYTITGEVAFEFCKVVSGMSEVSLRNSDAIPRQRIAAMPASALILQKLINKVMPQNVVFSALGIREGFLYDRLTDKEKVGDPLLLVCKDIGASESRFLPEVVYLSDWVAKLFPKEKKDKRRLRAAVCLLADIGWSEHPDYRAEQAYFRILRLPLVAITHKEKAMLALAVYLRYGGDINDHSLRAVIKLLDKDDVEWSFILGLAIGIAEKISGGKSQLLEGSKLCMGAKQLELHIDSAKTKLLSEEVNKQLLSFAKKLNKVFCLYVK
jgi:exopolyphosphatase/guanosine-5'-triphosphate,3'-diphosphate pyrophosphatase